MYDIRNGYCFPNITNKIGDINPKCIKSTYNIDTIKKVCEKISTGENFYKISKDTGIGYNTVGNIARGYVYKYVSKDYDFSNRWCQEKVKMVNVNLEKRNVSKLINFGLNFLKYLTDNIPNKHHNNILASKIVEKAKNDYFNKGYTITSEFSQSDITNNKYSIFK